MQFPASTGQVARALGTTEPRLNDLIRRQRINPEPPISGGRRLWNEAHLRAAVLALQESRRDDTRGSGQDDRSDDQ